MKEFSGLNQHIIFLKRTLELETSKCRSDRSNLHRLQLRVGTEVLLPQAMTRLLTYYMVITRMKGPYSKSLRGKMTIYCII